MATTEQIDWVHWILRLVAFIIDGIIFGIIAGVIGFLVPWGWLFTDFLWGIMLWLYFSVFDVYMGATIGKRLLGIQVQTVTGGRVTFDKALTRNITKIFTPLLLIDWLIGIVTPGDKRQKFLDRIAGVTFVRPTEGYSAYTSAPPPPPPPPPA
jgi:Predicted membrane protein/domain